jgi:hypothetical protein
MELVLGALVLIGIFVFCCDVTDSWNNVERLCISRVNDMVRNCLNAC